jgi:chemosensory pili system protein ChpA (sensor histidine kinase/response regulator)
MKVMQPVQEFDYSALQWVKGEIDETLNRARQALDAYYENSEEIDQVRLCANYLHQVHGTLQMTELDGPARMAEAMETSASGLLELEDEDRQEDAIEVLMRATLQLPDYLDRLLAGHRDIPAVLLPLINELRASVGRETLSPVDLFYPDLSVRPPHLVDRPLGDVRLTARRLRPVYQAGLVEWLRDKAGRKGLPKLMAVVEELRRGAGLPDAERLWWVATGFIEVLEQQPASAPAAKLEYRPLLAQIDRFIKRLIDSGEGSLTLRETGPLINRMLYHVGRSEARGRNCDDLRDAFGLDALLTPEDEIVAVRESLASANLSLMKTVSEALKEDLTSVMERLDVFTRQPKKELGDLPPLVDKLHLMSDTLAMLGSSEGPQRLREQAAILSEVAEGGRSPDQATLLTVARGLVEVEGTLEGLSRGTVQAASSEESDRVRVKRRQLFETVIKQAKLNTERVKEVIGDYVKHPQQDADLGGAVKRLDEIRGGLRVLELDRPAELFRRCAEFVGSSLVDAPMPPTAQMEHLAESISGLEYYLEGLIQGRGEQGMLLDRIETVIGRLASARPEVGPEEEVVPSPPAEAAFAEGQIEELGELAVPASMAEVVELEPAVRPEGGKAGAVVEEPEKEFALGLEMPAAAEEPKKEFALGLEAPAAAEEPEKELALGPEAPAAAEEPEKEFALGLEMPAAAEEPEKELALGLEAPAAAEEPEKEFALGLEAPAAAEEPEKEFALGLELEAEPSLPAESERELAAEAAVAPAPSEAVVPAFEYPEQAMDKDADPELLEIFIEEAHGEMEAMDEQLPRWIASPEDTDALTVLRRSFHTLKGSGRMVGAWLMGEFAWAFENLLNRVLDGSIQPTPELLRLVDQSRQAVSRLVAQLENGTEPDLDLEKMMGQAWALSQGRSVEVSEQPPRLAAAAAEAPSVEMPPAEEREEEREIGPAVAEEPVVEEVPIAPERDAVLVQIFAEEAEGHLEAIQSFVQACSSHGGEHCLLDATVLRALHTLVGSSRMVEVEEVGDLAAAVQEYAKAVAARQEPVSEQGTVLLRDCAGAIKGVLAALAAGDAKLPEHAEISDRAHALLEELHARPSEAKAEPVGRAPAVVVSFLDEAGRLLASADEALKAWRDEPESLDIGKALYDALESLRSGAHQAEYQSMAALADGELAVLDEARAGNLQPSDALFGMLGRIHERIWTLAEQAREGQALVHAEDLLQAIDDFFAKARLPATPEPVVEAPVQAPAVAPVLPLEELEEGTEPPLEIDYSGLDGDMLQVFTEEGEDIVNNSETLIQRLIGDPTNVELVSELRRDLHTLKGGARLAGLMPVGDVAHAVESLLEGVFDGHLTASTRAFELLQGGHDLLSDMVDRVREEAPLPSPKNLLNRLREFISQGVKQELSADEIAELAEAERPSEFSELALAAAKAAPSAEEQPPERRSGGSAQSTGQLRRRGEHCPGAYRGAGQRFCLQPAGAGADRYPPARAAAQAGDRDRGADPVPARDRGGRRHGVRSVGAGSLFHGTAIVPLPDGECRRLLQHPWPAVGSIPRRGDLVGSAGTGEYRAPGRPHACPYGSVRRPGTPIAADRKTDGKGAGKTGGAVPGGGRYRAGSGGDGPDGGSLGASAAQLGQSWHRAARRPQQGG